MRKLVVSVLTSLDGRYTGQGNDLSGIPFEDAFNDHNLALLERADTMVYGSTWFQENLPGWAAIGADPSQGEREHRTAELVLAMDALVISDSLTLDPDAPWAVRTRVVPRSEGAAEVARLKEGDGGDILVFGSSTTWNPLLAAGLVDELIVLVGAAVVGAGPVLYEGPRVPLQLVAADVLPGSHLVALRYAPAP